MKFKVEKIGDSAFRLFMLNEKAQFEYLGNFESLDKAALYAVDFERG